MKFLRPQVSFLNHILSIIRVSHQYTRQVVSSIQMRQEYAIELSTRPEGSHRRLCDGWFLLCHRRGIFSDRSA